MNQTHKQNIVTDMKKWYAIYTRSRAEKRVFEDLQNESIEAYLPIQKTIRQWSQRKKLVEVPFIPGYCFVKINPLYYLSVLQTNNVVSFVRFNGKFAEIPENQIDTIKRMLKQGDYQVEVSHEQFSIGEKVSVIAGPLIGLSGELVSLRGRNKFVVKIEQINCSFLIEIPRSDIQIFQEDLLCSTNY